MHGYIHSQSAMEYTTRKVLASTQLPKGELCTYTPPTSPSFKLSEEEFTQITPVKNISCFNQMVATLVAGILTVVCPN